MTTINEFLLPDEKILYKSEKDLKAFLWIMPFFILYILFLGFTSWFYFNESINKHYWQFLIFALTLFLLFIIFTYICTELIFNFSFLRLYISNKRIILYKSILKQFKEIKFENIQYSYYAYGNTVVIKLINKKKHIFIRHVKEPLNLVTKISELSQSERSPFNCEKFKNAQKVRNKIITSVISIFYIGLYVLFLFNSHYFTAYYYKYQGFKSMPKYHSQKEFELIKNTAAYKNNLNKSIEYYTKAIKYDPLDTKSYFMLFVAYRSLKQYDNAIYILQNALNTDPQYSDWIYFDLGLAYEDTNNYNLAIENFKKSLIGETNDNFKHKIYGHLALLNKKQVSSTTQNDLKNPIYHW